MSATLTTRVQVNVNATLADTVGLQSAQADLAVAETLALASGTGLNQADKIYSNTYAIATAGTQSIDVSAALTDALGGTFVPVKVKLVLIVSNSANTTNLTLFGDANSLPILNTAATTVTLPPGGIFLLANPSLAGIAVTAGTGDIIKIVNAAGATANVKVVIVGTSA